MALKNDVVKVGPRRMVKWIVIGLIVLVVIVTAINSVAVVGSGKAGVVTTMGAVHGRVLGEGLHFITPFIQNVIQIDVRTQKIEAYCSAVSKDLQSIATEVAVNYHVVRESASRLYQDVGMSYADVIITPAIQESVKKVTAQYSAEENITRREEVSNIIKEGLEEKLSGYGIYIDGMNILNLDFSDEFNKAIEAKQTAQQQALKAEQDLSRIKIEAQQKVEQAKADADATRAKADAEAYSIQKIQEQLAKDPRYIEYFKYEKWDGKLPIYEGSATPIIDLRLDLEPEISE